ncbi:SusC/RagA family TonB-linked outer membrane protein [Flavitalea sp. BT771]|uniref:SusC/RagA family TonB-linked outer membrane protein n=1 Tax=Flavitalea sp. BT771 TaxID=3063329 RepID=UPI0026E19EEC|nr:SusC/RagA family TonB-linked outer membrane protein [Flavitalea sp. BT771]MDO6431691.1 SusC/RagA family TonB-linked outer membrane protein [Flavitalea sp. BT771]MDV6220599.1 SusC/RagA family TonB-linked outer membrane protein [Flavitalea sp. BT771]
MKNTCFLLISFLLLKAPGLYASINPSAPLRDTTAPLNKDIAGDSIILVKRVTVYNKLTDSVNKKPDVLALFPSSSLQQAAKGQFAGLYVQEPSGEPGSVQNMFVRGAPMPLLSRKELYQSQPLVVLDGIPLVDEHPFAFDIQQYDFNRIGPATNIYGSIDMDNIASIEVLKDLTATMAYGPRAVNGVILLKSKAAMNQRSISFNSYVGVAERPHVATTNGKFENAFRQKFYDLYTTNGRYSSDEQYPIYLSDSLNNVYSGQSNWSDLYYRNAVIYGINLGISGGNDRANFRFSLGDLKSKGVADQTGLDRYSVMFNINMKPIKWLLFSAMINGNMMDRQRNRNMRDRFAQMNYFPDLSAPLAPNKEYYRQYLAQFDKSFDKNKTNLIQGYARLALDLGKFNLSSTFNIDYNEGYRDIFYARTLLQGTSYASNYYGFNQRVQLINKSTYDVFLHTVNKLHVEFNQAVQWDTYKYNNAYAYKGANDFIKINLLDSDPKRDGNDNANYLNPIAFPRELTYRFLDKTGDVLASFYGTADYTIRDKYTFSASLRADGSSNAQPTSRWFYSPVVAAAWNLKNEFLEKNKALDDLVLRISAGRLGRLHAYDNFAQGPQYTATTGYTGNLTVPGYNAFSVLTRPYSFGWVGYGIPWGYSDQVNIGTDLSLLRNRLHVSLDWYKKIEKDLLIGIPAFAEYGYKQSIEPGMSVSNTGLDLSARAEVLRGKKVSWSAGINVNYNRNNLRSLPRGLKEIVIGNRLLQVGRPVDQYWLFVNQGIYTADNQVPVVKGLPLKYNGVSLRAGDPRWKDMNGDNVLDNKDKILKGHSLPVLSGGMDHTFKYGPWSLSLDFYYTLGRKIMHQEMANKFDFVNRESNLNMNSVKEITFWEDRGDFSKYPLYNPWSTVIPYRIDQDLFLENASFLKLRSLVLGYDLSKYLAKKGLKSNRFFVYASVNNVFTITPYTGVDPELVGYDGYDAGYGQPIPRIYTLGIKTEL